MKLKNKISGEIKEFALFDGNELQGGATLESLTKEWEDYYEEPKEFYWIDYDGEVKTFITSYEWQEKMKEIGNYFDTREEAERAVEKLKAWKRMKEQGFTFKTYQRSPQGTYDIYANWGGYIPPLSWAIDKDLNLLFGGEE